MNTSEKQTTVCLFAHPDDEAFGPGGTIAKLSDSQDVYIICATRGEAGGTQENLGEMRTQELQNSARILGVKEVVFLDYKDGELNNNLYHAISEDIKIHLDSIRPETLLTYEPRGVSGHIDHIVISMITNFLFEECEYIKKLMFFCHAEDHMNIVNKYFPHYFIYHPPGYSNSEIDEKVDTSGFYDKHVAAIKCHISQEKDLKNILPMYEELPKEECFLVREK